MDRVLASLALSLLGAGFLAACTPVANDSGGIVAPVPVDRNSIRVLWTVKSYVMGPEAQMTEEQAQAMLFKPLDMTDNSITFDFNACNGIRMSAETVEAATFLADAWHTTRETLAIDDAQLEVRRTNCGLPGFQEFVRLKDGRLVVPIQGVFFFFEPKVLQ